MALAALLMLILDLGFLRGKAIATRFLATSTVAIAGCLLAFLTLTTWPAQGSLSGGMLVVTPLTQWMQEALLALAILILLMAASVRFTAHAGEYCALILFATAAMMLLVSTQNLLLLFITIEFLSLSLYILTGFDKESARLHRSRTQIFPFWGHVGRNPAVWHEPALRISGSLALPSIAATVQRDPADPLLMIAVVMVLAGFGFKIAAAPFHMWAPEVYRGAPTASAALVASSSKVASFFSLSVVFYYGLAPTAGSAAWGHSSAGWALLIALLAVASMVWGNLAAIAQTSVRSLLAYSAVGHAGYMLIALVAHSRQRFGLAGLLRHYVCPGHSGAFGVLAALQDEGIGQHCGLP